VTRVGITLFYVVCGSALADKGARLMQKFWFGVSQCTETGASPQQFWHRLTERQHSVDMRCALTDLGRVAPIHT